MDPPDTFTDRVTDVTNLGSAGYLGRNGRRHRGHCVNDRWCRWKRIL